MWCLFVCVSSVFVGWVCVCFVYVCVMYVWFVCGIV